jgi:protein SCO1/2
MKVLLFVFFVAVAFGCSDSNSKSAFVGEVPKSAAAPVGTISSESIYQLPDTFETQDNKKIVLSSFAGKPTVVGMIFTHCPYACPRLTADIKGIEDKIKSKSEDVNYLLISFDSERDLPNQLKKFSNDHALDENWTLLHGDENTIRILSVLLNVQFQKDAEGNFSHSNIISVLDKNGVLVFQKEGIDADPAETISAIKQLL